MEKKHKLEGILEKIVYFGLLMYMLDVVLLGTGELTKNFGIPTRMIFFAIAVLGAFLLIALNLKEYLNNKYFWLIALFMFVLCFSALRGVLLGNDRTILATDFKGFLNYLILFPMIVTLNKKDRVISFLKICTACLGCVAVLGIVLAFYLQMPLLTRIAVYDFFDGYNICMITELTEKATRIFFNTGSRLFFAGFTFSVVFSILEEKYKKLWILIASLNVFGIFISYTRSGYLAFVAGVFCLIFLVLLFYKDFVKDFLIKSISTAIIVVVLIGGVSVAEQANLASVAISRCLFAGAEIDSTDSTDSTDVGGDDSNPNEDDNQKLINAEAETQNLEIRDQRKMLAIENIKRHPVIGGGLGVSNDVNDDFIEYFYLDILSKIGFVGVIIFVIPFFVSIFDTIVLRDIYCREQKLLSLAAQLGGVFIFVISYFNPCLNSSVGLFIYALALTLSCPWIEKKENGAIVVSATNHYSIRAKKIIKQFENDGYDVTYVTSDFDHMTKLYYEFSEPIQYKQLHVNSYKKNISIRRLLSHLIFSYKTYYYCCGVKPKLLYVEVPNNSLAKYGAKYKRTNSVELIMDIFDMWPESMPVKTNNYIINKAFGIWRSFRNKYIKYADKVWIECDLYRELLQKQNVHNKMETRYLTLEKDSVVFEANKYEDEINLCYLGSVNNIIDIDLITEIVSEIAKFKRPIVHIIGDGEKKTEFVQLLKNNKIKTIDYGKIYEQLELQTIFNRCEFGLNVLKQDLAIGVTMKSISYFKGGLPIINTVSGDTYNFVKSNKMGVNVKFDDIPSTAKEIVDITEEELYIMKKNARDLFEKIFAE